MDHLQLELALSNQNLGENRNLASKKKKKRTFHESFSDETSSERTLPLLIWGDESENEIHSRESSIAAGYTSLSLSLSRSVNVSSLICVW